MQEDLQWRRRAALAGAGLAAFATFQVLARAPDLTEALYGSAIGPLLASALSRLSALAPISLAEIVIGGFVARQLVGAVQGLLAVRRGKRTLRHALASGALRCAADIGVVVAMFYLLWGFNYARAPLEQRTQWNGRGADIEELSRLTRETIDAANAEYRAIASTDDLERPSKAPPAGVVIERLDAGWQAAGEVIGTPRNAIFGFGRPKGLLASPVLDYQQTSGFYFPWTGEANYNRGTPEVSLPHVIAHEMSHQRGFAREDEANFAGYLAASLAPGSYSRYSAYVFAQRQLLSTLARYDRDRARQLMALRLPGVQRDITAAATYWAQFEGRASRASRSVYDAYLRGNRIPDGVLSYGRSVELLIGYARSRGGRLVPE